MTSVLNHIPGPRRRSGVLLWLLSCLMLVGSLAATPFPAWPQARNTAPPPLLQEAEQLYRAHRYPEALQRYEQFLATSPPPGPGQHAWLRTAQLYGIRGDWQEARRRYEKLLASHIESGIALQARYGAGQAHYKLGNYPEAERILGNLSASTLPGELRFKTNALLTELSLQAGNWTQAWSRLLLVEKDLAAGEEEWFQDLKARLLSRAGAPDLEKMADLYRDHPLSAEILLQLVKVEVQAGRPDRAREHLGLLQQRFPGSPQTAQAAQLLPGPAPQPVAPTQAVGCLLPLSGENADAGRQVKNGVELAASQAGVALILKDSGNDSSRTASALEELASNPQVVAVLGFFPSVTAEAAAEAAQRLEIPLLALTQKKDLTLARPFVFRDFLTPRLMLQALIQYTVTTLGWQRYAILYPTSKYGQSLARQFGDEIDRQGARLVAQASYAEGGGDLAQAVEALTQINPGGAGPTPLEAVFVPDEAQVVMAVAQALTAASLPQVRLLGTNILHAPATLDFGEPLNGLLLADGFFAGDSDPAVKALVADFRQRYQQPPTYLAAQGYSSLRLLAATLKEFPGLSRLEFASRLTHQTQPPGFSLFRGFNHEREAEVNTRILTIRQGKFVLEK